MSSINVAEPDKMADLVAFARLEVESGDLEPWAGFLKCLRKSTDQDDETALWLVKLYNAFDSMSSAWNVYQRWPLPKVWDLAHDKADVSNYPHMQERRNLHGGRGRVRFQSYCDQMSRASMNQRDWLRLGVRSETPETNFLNLMEHTQRVWGVGRLSAFEWVEFLGKVMEWPIHAPDAQLWLSSGPRKSLQKLYGNPEPTQGQLDEYARHCRQHLKEEGVDLPWEDFETVICDFNVMRGGRYYPGRHLAALRGEIEELPEEHRDFLLHIFKGVVPEPWNQIAPFIDRTMMPRYKDTGKISLPVEL